jgi:hypothetical protein
MHECPQNLPLLQEAQITSSSDGKRACRNDVDVDAQTLLALHTFEAHLHRRPVQLRLTRGSKYMIGEMNPTFSLGAPADRSRHMAKMRLSFYDLQDGDCVDAANNE